MTVFIRELITPAWTLMTTAHLDWYLEEEQTDLDGKKIERNIRPSCKSERGSGHEATTVHGGRKGRDSVNSEWGTCE